MIQAQPLINDDEVLVALPPLSPLLILTMLFSRSHSTNLDYGHMQDQAFDINHLFSSSEDVDYSDHGDYMEENGKSTTGDIHLHISKRM